MISLEMYVLTLKVNPNGNTPTVLITAPFSTDLFSVKFKKNVDKIKHLFKTWIQDTLLISFSVTL